MTKFEIKALVLMTEIVEYDTDHEKEAANKFSESFQNPLESVLEVKKIA